ncbi:Bacteriophage abortive infection AbiH [Marinilactibacillus piezotolerans]|uniref:Bacteriophage abortive infection AbiH n=1 Tax=Marinilactibacillus piezotolerans TaxID=258723 RepID=A0A1I4BHV2_9LACT|nr:AbiH family protein [Marinilactibacillus piezotolerans]SFK67599.1 Bacteriophage abortive infection AbiH [Marinilactibacillus piezotolerans]
MNNRLFIIGNGFDLSHNLPTKFDPHFKEIAEKYEQIPYFWELYQSQEVNIWSNFENLLAKPNFNELEQIFEGYQPNYLSNHESDRDAIITQVELNGNLSPSLYEFSNQAEEELNKVSLLSENVELFNNEDLFVNFNYTHTLEKVYGIRADRVLHIHGEVGQDNLILGYPKGNFSPEKYQYDVRQKGRGPYREIDIREHIENMIKDDMMDYYTYTAFESLINKVESFNKEPQLQLLEKFLIGAEVKEIIVKGHSCAIDFYYFNLLNEKFRYANWLFYSFDKVTSNNIKEMIKNLKIKNYKIL